MELRFQAHVNENPSTCNFMQLSLKLVKSFTYIYNIDTSSEFTSFLKNGLILKQFDWAFYELFYVAIVYILSQNEWNLKNYYVHFINHIIDLQIAR